MVKYDGCSEWKSLTTSRTEHSLYHTHTNKPTLDITFVLNEKYKVGLL